MRINDTDILIPPPSTPLVTTHNTPGALHNMKALRNRWAPTQSTFTQYTAERKET